MKTSVMDYLKTAGIEYKIKRHSRDVYTKKLAKIFGCKKVQIAPKEEVEKATGYKIGAIAPIGFKREMKIYMDKDVLKEEIVDISSGRPDAGIELKSEDLVKITKAEIIKVD